MAAFALARDFDAAAAAALFREHGRLQIPDFLSRESAQALLGELQGSKAWRLTANRGDQVIDFRPEVLAAFGEAEWAKLDKAVTMGGRYAFQFRYEAIRLSADAEAAKAEAPLLADFAGFMSSPDLLAAMRTLTGAGDIAFADAHASRYTAGHFLAAHDDRADTMGRRAAYVLNLTPHWRPDWGGLLLFHDADGNIVRGFTPGFNSLNLFRVPQTHSVSWVTPLAAEPRYAVTGWLRAR
ncbi:MAG TPA: 2OG-Fe(II) oxygenase family protein [Allosphingosinicella sp.]|jgi:Rps23 Pro-64 3,4-dihydroxylase Tpa1-like proline 4-hydroxylase